MAELCIERFIRGHPDEWQDILKKPPYCISVKKDGEYILLSYSHLNSDFSEPVVCESRGLILHETDGLVCLSFYKFFNYGEQYAAKIDWSTATVSEKIDGSLMKVWYHNGWHLSTNGTIDAFKAAFGEKGRTFGDVFIDAAGVPFDEFCKRLIPGHVYMFELVSPETRVVIGYDHTSIYHLATRDMNTRRETEEDIGVQKPKKFPFRSIDDVLNVAKTLDACHEGFVVCDKNYNRVKIKSEEYLAAAHLNNNGVLTVRRIIRMWQNEQLDDFLAYCPQNTKPVERVLSAFRAFEKDAAKKAADAVRECGCAEEVANRYNDDLAMRYISRIYRGRDITPEEYLRGARMPFLISVVEHYSDKYIS